MSLVHARSLEFIRVEGLGILGCTFERFLPRLLLSSNFIVANDESLTQYLSLG